MAAEVPGFIVSAERPEVLEFEYNLNRKVAASPGDDFR